MDVEIPTGRSIISRVVTASRQVARSGNLGLGMRGESDIRPRLAAIDHGGTDAGEGQGELSKMNKVGCWLVCGTDLAATLIMTTFITHSFEDRQQVE